MRCPICDVLLEETELKDDLCRTCSHSVWVAITEADPDEDGHLLVEEDDVSTL